MTHQLFNNAGNVGHAAPTFSYHYNRASDFWSPIQSNEFYLNLSAGFISGMQGYVVHGRNSDVDAPADICEGNAPAYRGFPTGSAETFSLFSSDSRDTATGVGLRSVSIFGLDQNFIQAQETLNLSGTDYVTTTGSYKRLTKIFGETAGVSGLNLGVITTRHTTTTGNVFSEMPAGFGESQDSAFTVPSGFRGYVDGMMGSIFDRTTNKAVLSLYSREPGKSVRMKRPFSISTESALDAQAAIYLEFEEMTDLIMRVLSVNNANADISSSYAITLIKK